MGAKIKGNVSVWKPILAITAGVLVVVVLFLAWQYAINRPNYHDLQKEFNKLQVPADWKLVDESSNKGVLGLFCWQIEGSECPYIGAKYSNNISLDPIKDSELLINIIESNGFQLIELDTTNCVDDIKNYYCSIESRKNKMSLEVSIGAEDSTKILRVHLGQYAKP